MRRIILGFGVLSILSIGTSVAQTPTFEVVSIKLNTSGDVEQAVRRQPGGRITVTNIPARQLIVNAYQLQPFQLVGGPPWISR